MYPWKKIAENWHIGIYKTYLHQIFRVGRHIGEDDQTDIRFAVAQGMLLW